MSHLLYCHLLTCLSRQVYMHGYPSGQVGMQSQSLSLHSYRHGSSGCFLGAVKPGDEGDDVGVEGEDAGAVPLLVGGADGAGGSDDTSFPPPLAPWPVELRQ